MTGGQTPQLLLTQQPRRLSGPLNSTIRRQESLKPAAACRILWCFRTMAVPFRGGLEIKRMKRVLAILTIAVLASGCRNTMTAPEYAVSTETAQMLKRYIGAKVRLSSLQMRANIGACLPGNVPFKFPDGMSASEYIQKAFNDEFRSANIFSDSGIDLTGSLTTMSQPGLIQPEWHLGVKLTSSNGASLIIESKYPYEYGFIVKYVWFPVHDNVGSCNEDTRALGPAVQELIRKVVSDPHFAQLIR